MHFRMHLHTREQLSNGVTAKPYHPSGADYANGLTHQNHGINSYAGAVRNGKVELYHYTYENNKPSYRIATW